MLKDTIKHGERMWKRKLKTKRTHTYERYITGALGKRRHTPMWIGSGYWVRTPDFRFGWFPIFKTHRHTHSLEYKVVTFHTTHLRAPPCHPRRRGGDFLVQRYIYDITFILVEGDYNKRNECNEENHSTIWFRCSYAPFACCCCWNRTNDDLYDVAEKQRELIGLTKHVPAVMMWDGVWQAESNNSNF